MYNVWSHANAAMRATCCVCAPVGAGYGETSRVRGGDGACMGHARTRGRILTGTRRLQKMVGAYARYARPRRWLPRTRSAYARGRDNLARQCTAASTSLPLVYVCVRHEYILYAKMKSTSISYDPCYLSLI
jgi:hypothetical protein